MNVRRLLRVLAVGTGALVLLLLASAALLLYTPAGPPVARAVAARVLPAQIRLGRLEGRLAGRLRLDALTVELDSVRVVVRDAEVEFSPWALVDLRVAVARAHAGDVEVTLLAGGAPATDDGPPEGAPHVPGLPIDLDVTSASADRVSLRRGAEALLSARAVRVDAARWNGEVAAAGAITVAGETAAFAGAPASRFRAAASANLPTAPTGPHRAHVELDLEADGYPTAHAVLELRGDLEALDVELRTDAPTTLTLTGRLRGLAERTLQGSATLSAPALDLAALDPRLPAVTVRGDVDLELPPTDGADRGPQLVLRPALAVAGPLLAPLDAVEVAGEVAVAADGIEARPLTLRLPAPAEGSAALEGRLALDGATRTLDAHLALRAVDPARLRPALPGRLDGDVDLRLRQAGDSLRAAAEAIRVSGTLRDYPVSLAGAVRYADGTVTFEEVLARSGDARLSVDGTVAQRAGAAAGAAPTPPSGATASPIAVPTGDERLDLRFDLDVPALAAVLPEAQGALRADGTVAGTARRPRLQTRVRGNALQAAGTTLDALALDATVADDGTLELRGTLDALAVPGRTIDAVRLDGTGTLDAHRLTVVASSREISLDTTVGGGWTGEAWQGDFEALTLGLGSSGWRLQPSAAGAADADGPGIALSATRQRLAATCLASEGSTACVAAEHGDGRTVAELSLGALPIGQIAALASRNVEVTGSLDGSARIELRETGSDVEIDLEISPGRLLNLLTSEDGDPLLTWRGARFEGTTTDAGAFEGNAAIDLGDTGRIDVAASTALTGYAAVGDVPLRARVEAQLTVPKDLANLSTAIAAIGGDARLDVAIDGTLGNPTIAGTLNASGLRASITPAGVDLADGRATGRFDGDSAHLEVAVDSGDGTLAVTSDFTRGEAGWGGTLTVRGDRVTAADTPQVTALISPDLTATVDPAARLVAVGGTLTVPEARLTPIDLSGAVRPSADEQIVGVEAEGAGGGWQTRTNVTLVLGDAVRLKGYGLDGRLTGRLTVDERPGQLLVGNGELSLAEATYGAFGQVLTVDRGRVIFIRSPVTNPGLDVSASREIEADDVTVRVDVRGTLRDQQITISSTPTLPQADALSYLVVGRPISGLSGGEGDLLQTAARKTGIAGADLLARRVGKRIGVDELGVESTDSGAEAQLVVGKYLSPRLYVRYGLGLFESLNTWLLRYDLTERWSVETETGAQNSADVLYSIEQ